jgi:hypothetical protein
MNKHLKYLSYVLRHKYFVFVECCKVGLFWQGLVHDLSKFSSIEWFPYVEFFYGDSGWVRGSSVRPPKDIDDKFDFAWLCHQHNNPHHWQYWIRHGDDGTIRVFPMSDKHRKEMLCDWKGAGKAITGSNDSKNWYMVNRDKMTLHEETRKWIEQQLEV